MSDVLPQRDHAASRKTWLHHSSAESVRVTLITHGVGELLARSFSRDAETLQRLAESLRTDGR